MYKNLLVKQLEAYEDEFKDFMGIEEFPIYELQTKEA